MIIHVSLLNFEMLQYEISNFVKYFYVTRWWALSTRLFQETALLSRVETIAHLWAMGWWEENQRYWSVWVQCISSTSKNDITCPFFSLRCELVDGIDIRVMSSNMFHNYVGHNNLHWWSHCCCKDLLVHNSKGMTCISIHYLWCKRYLWW